MSTNYEDWADWAGDHHEQAEAELRRLKPQTGGAAIIVEQCEHAEVDNQGVCENCATEVEGWEPDEQQIDQHHGTSVAA